MKCPSCIEREVSLLEGVNVCYERVHVLQSVLNTELSLFQGGLLRGVPLYT